MNFKWAQNLQAVVSIKIQWMYNVPINTLTYVVILIHKSLVWQKKIHKSLVKFITCIWITFPSIITAIQGYHKHLSSSSTLKIWNTTKNLTLWFWDGNHYLIFVVFFSSKSPHIVVMVMHAWNNYLIKPNLVSLILSAFPFYFHFIYVGNQIRLIRLVVC